MAVAGIIVSTIMSTRATSKRSITDFHAHCLPAVDDGARDVAMALAMLTQAGQQGAETVIATPHFYWGEDTPESFLHNRQQALDRLRPQLDNSLPQVKLGAEVLVREHVSRLDLRALCIEGTDILLVELPFMRAPYWLLEELENIALDQRLTLMLAHLDRYMPWYSKRDLEPLLELPNVIVQLNAESIVDKQTFRSLRKWLPDCPRLVLGSDMHDLRHRAPELDKAVREMAHNRTGRLWLERIDATTGAVWEPDLSLDLVRYPELEGWI